MGKRLMKRKQGSPCLFTFYKKRKVRENHEKWYIFKVGIPNPFRAKTIYKLCYSVISFFHLSFHAISFAWDILRVCTPNRFVVWQFFVLPDLQIWHRVWNTVGHISNCCVKTETAIFIAMCTHHPHGIVNHSTKEKTGVTVFVFEHWSQMRSMAHWWIFDFLYKVWWW